MSKPLIEYQYQFFIRIVGLYYNCDFEFINNVCLRKSVIYHLIVVRCILNGAVLEPSIPL